MAMNSDAPAPSRPASPCQARWSSRNIRRWPFAGDLQNRVLVLTAYGTYPVPDAKVDEKTLKPGAYGAPLRGFGV